MNYLPTCTSGVISLCCAVCRQNRGFGRILDTGITCLSWSSPHTVPRPPPLTPDLLTTVYRVSLELSLCVELSQNRYFPTTPDTWSRPFGTCICSTCWDQSWHNMTMDVTPPILTTGLTSIQRSWSYLSLFCCFQPKFDVSCYCIVLGQRVAVWRCWINVWHDVCTSYLPTCQPPPPPPFFAAAATDQNGVSKYFILYMKIHRAPG